MLKDIIEGLIFLTFCGMTIFWGFYMLPAIMGQ